MQDKAAGRGCLPVFRGRPLRGRGFCVYLQTFRNTVSEVISVEGLAAGFGAKPLFSGATFVIGDRERAALVGRNGAGKSTLLKIMAGEMPPAAGSVRMSRGAAVGYLPQVMRTDDTLTVMQEAEKAFAGTERLRARVERLERELNGRADCDSEEYMRLVELYAAESERCRMADGGNSRALAERALAGLGFERKDFDRPTSEFSGGWRMRVELAKILLRRPDVLLLDEPTNHLDIESIQWLESFLAGSPCAALIVSHDRAFMNNVTSRTLEISAGRINDYRASYDGYVKMQAERREHQLRAYENQQKEIAGIRSFVERFRYKPAKSNQVQSRLKQLEKMKPVEVDAPDGGALRLKFPPCARSGDFPLVCEGVSKSYGGRSVFSGVSLSVRRGEKVAFVGKNGAGKSTLVKCIMGEIPFEGELRVGHNVEIGYCAQNQAQLLDESLTVFDTVDRAARGEARLRIRDILGAFMFGGEEGDKRVKFLSGGERSRLAMIKLLLEPVNFLILDEPTNHLDMRTKDILKEAVRAFGGTAVIVSHDRDFLDGLVTKVYEFGGGKVREYMGGIYDFLEKYGQARAAGTPRPADASPVARQPAAPAEGRAAYERQKERAKRLRRLERCAAEAERNVTELEAAVKMLESRMSGSADAAAPELFAKHASMSGQLEAAMAEWETAERELEQFSAES